MKIKISIPTLMIVFSLMLTACPEPQNSTNIEEEVNVDKSKKRQLKLVTFTGTGYELGLQHGKKLKNEIAEIVGKWKENTTKSLNKDADLVLKEFMDYANFVPVIKQWTPELYDEVKGIAEGSEQNFDDILVLNLLDEFWVYVDNPENHHCSDLGVPAQNGEPTIVAQNMDIESYTDGYQTLMRIQSLDSGPDQLVLTHPGLIALNGLNRKGVGVVVNTIMQLQATPSGLPVAFVVRKIISMTDKEEILDFIQTVPHASGQSYIIGVEDEVFNFEASATKVVGYNPGNENGTVYHTNHPILNDNVKQWHIKDAPNDPTKNLPRYNNSQIRLNSLENGLSEAEEINTDTIMKILRSKDDPENPVCRSWKPGGGFTFASTIMKLGDSPQLLITAGPPDESDYIMVKFDE